MGKTAKISDLVFDDKNFNKHTELGIALIEKSLRDNGAGRSILIDKNNRIIGGNGVVEAAGQIGLEDVQIVETDGTKIIAVKRTDIDLDSKQGREMALADNATGAADLDWDAEAIADVEAEFDLDFSGWGVVLDDGEISNGEIERKAREFQERMEAGDIDETDEEYQEFLEKFKLKKTTDDCYTPDIVYDAVAKWVSDTYKIDRRHFERPFYPGGDYKNAEYPKGCVVVDNPPFSILAEITRFYKEHNIRFFLFAPRISNLSVANAQGFTNLCVGAGITYDNGAIVPTSFITNLESECVAKSSPSLYKTVTAANEKVLAGMHREIPKYEYPDEVVTAAMLSKYSKYGVEYGVKFTECKYISALDAQKEVGKAIYAGGLLVSNNKALEKAAAEKAAAEKAAATKWGLSEREKDIVRRLNNG